MKMKDRLRGSFSHSFRQAGQSMIEYTVVVGLGVMALTAAMSSGGSEQNAAFPDTYSAKEALFQRMQDHYTGYSYVISLSDYPDANNPLELYALYNSQDLPDDLVIYLTDYPDQFISALMNYQTAGFPSVQDGLDFINAANLSPSSFLNPSFP